MSCGLCCNGAIFADVELQPGDVAGELQALGLRFTAASQQPDETANAAPQPKASRKFCQPCSAFDGSRCRIYQDRPVYCREFECLLLAKFRERRTPAARALRQIRKAKENVHRVLNLLRQLGDTDENLPLTHRFGRTRNRLEAVGVEPALAGLYGQLTVAVVDLNFILSGVFYPG